jgi:hypothetical protein
MSTKDEARAAVLAIAKRYGFVKRETLARLDAEARLEIEEVVRALSKTAAHSINT